MRMLDESFRLLKIDFASRSKLCGWHGKISSVVKLADVCTNDDDDDDDDDDDELKKDAKFTDDTGALQLNYEASNKLMSMYLNMQRQ